MYETTSEERLFGSRMETGWSTADEKEEASVSAKSVGSCMILWLGSGDYGRRDCRLVICATTCSISGKSCRHTWRMTCIAGQGREEADGKENAM